MEFNEGENNYKGDLEDNDSITLPPDTLAILKEFLQNQKIRESMESQQATFEEDWQLSQFWYNENTISALSKLCSNLIINHHKSSGVSIALLSCPSLYKSFKSVNPNGIIRLFEFDSRFSAFGDDFVYYDYKDVRRNETLFKSYENFFDIIVADPPFLSRECIEHTANIIRRIKKSDTNIIMCSGQTTAIWLEELLMLNMCEFRPEHERNLANEFRTYANFDLDGLM